MKDGEKDEKLSGSDAYIHLASRDRCIVGEKSGVEERCERRVMLGHFT